MRARALLAALLLAACAAPPAPPETGWRQVRPPPPITILFAPDSTRPLPEDAARLRALRPLPAIAEPQLHIAGPLAIARAEAVGRLLHRAVTLHPAGAPGSPDAAILALAMPPGLVSDRCLAPPARGVAGLSPEHDFARAQLLPPGCASAATLAAQILDERDLVRGRPLPPGAATPFAAAIERYYRRHETGGAGSPGSAPAAHAVGGGGTVPAMPQGGEANPLLGPLPGVPLGGQPQAQQPQPQEPQPQQPGAAPP